MATTERVDPSTVPSSTVHLARALVGKARRRGAQEDPHIEEIARIRLPEEVPLSEDVPWPNGVPRPEEVDLTAMPPTTIRLARALVTKSQRRGYHEDPRIEQIAQIPLPEEAPDLGNP